MSDDYRNIRTHVIEPICCRMCDEAKGLVGFHRRFVVCQVCGNKRCPKADDHRNDCTGSNEPNQRVTRDMSTDERREFWRSAQDVSDIVSGWPDSKRAGINVSDRRKLTCAVCGSPASGKITHNFEGQRYVVCIAHPGLLAHDVARIVALRSANVRLVSENESLKRELHRWQTGNEIEGDYVEHWIARSDFEELEKHASELERQLLDLTAERDRLLTGFTDATAKHKVYRREIRRLQRALLAERGAGVTDELERQSRVFAGFQARIEALEGDGK